MKLNCGAVPECEQNTPGVMWRILRWAASRVGARERMRNVFLRVRGTYRRRKRERQFRLFCRQLVSGRDDCDVTAVILTVDGSESFEACRKSLDRQLLRPRQIEIVRNVFPFSKASQAALDCVRTTFYVPVDDDMILHPTCFARLCHTIQSTPMCAESLARLQDPIMGAIVGVRMYRTEVARSIGFYPLVDEKGCERSMLAGLLANGYVSRNCQVVEGLHHPRYLPLESFWKFKFMAEKTVYYGDREPTFRETVGRICRYWLQTRDEAALYALAGLFQGLQSNDMTRELTYEGREADPAYRKIHDFLCHSDVDGR